MENEVHIACRSLEFEWISFYALEIKKLCDLKSVNAYE
jgi:hypothetical protein